jgi:hypothetical protein
MSSIVPPLDKIPNLPGMGVSKILASINKQTDKLVNDIQQVVKDSIKLPDDCGCNDPRVTEIKKQLENVQKQLDAINKITPNIQKTVKTLKTLTATALTIKTTLAAIQLLNPVTAPVFIAQQLTLIQDATIVNALESIKLLKSVPESVATSLAAAVPPLQDSISTIASKCGKDQSTVFIPKSIVDIVNDGISVNDGVSSSSLGLSVDDYNDLIDTEFYTEYNVSDSDLLDRADAIQRLVEQQQDLLTSLREAPAQVYKDTEYPLVNGVPPTDLGKVGDYYVNSSKMIVYYKISDTIWQLGI